MNRRENTFRVDYSNVPRKPTSEEVHLFVGTMLGLKREQVKRIQCNRSLGCAFVKVVDLATAQKVVEEQGELHEIVHEDIHYPLKITMEDGAVDVKVTDLSEAVTSATIVEFLKRYGDVISIHEQVTGETHLFGALPNGVRIIRMLVKTNIPSFVVIDSETTAVSYFGQKQTCRHCAEFVHNGVSCVINKKLLAQKLAADTNTTYASVAKQPTQPSGSKPAKQKQNEPPKKTSASGKTAGAQPNSSQQPTQFKQRNLTLSSDAATSGSTTSMSNMPPPIAPLLAPPLVNPNPADDDGESDGSTASSDSRNLRNRQQTKKQKTAHGNNTTSE